jgi:hypothetical protein
MKSGVPTQHDGICGPNNGPNCQECKNYLLSGGVAVDTSLMPGSEYLGISSATYRHDTGSSYKGVISTQLTIVSFHEATGVYSARVTSREITKQVEDYPSYEAIPNNHPLKNWASTLNSYIIESTGSFDSETRLLTLTDQAINGGGFESFLKRREYVLHADRLIGCDHYLDADMGVEARAVNLQLRSVRAMRANPLLLSLSSSHPRSTEASCVLS